MDRILSTKRLLIRIYTAEQMEQYFATKPKPELQELFHLTSDESFELARQKAMKGYTTHRSSVRFFYMYHKLENRLVGDVAFHNWYPEHRRSEIGYMIFNEEDKKHGYMSEAVQAILTYGFNEMNLNRVEACIGPMNLASQSLVLKFGFKLEGHLRQHYHKEGELQDSIIYGLLKEEFLHNQNT